MSVDAGWPGLQQLAFCAVCWCAAHTPAHPYTRLFIIFQTLLGIHEFRYYIMESSMYILEENMEDSPKKNHRQKREGENAHLTVQMYSRRSSTSKLENSSSEASPCFTSISSIATHFLHKQVHTIYQMHQQEQACQCRLFLLTVKYSSNQNLLSTYHQLSQSGAENYRGLYLNVLFTE